MIKSIVIITVLILGLIVACDQLPKRWYMESGQRKRFEKIDSMKALHEKWKEIYTKDMTKYDSLKPLIDTNFRNWELEALDAEIRAYELMGF